jgi:hypothetical protein
MALGEARFSGGRGNKNIFVGMIGRGVGNGIVINGEIYRSILFPPNGRAAPRPADHPRPRPRQSFFH